MDLEHYRLVHGMTYEQLAGMIGTRSVSAARRYALGEMWPNAMRLEQILARSGGTVTLEHMHRRHLGWVRDRAERYRDQAA